jgi:hypothetical protein
MSNEKIHINTLSSSSCSNCGAMCNRCVCGDMTPRRGDWLQTHSGTPFWVLDPLPGDVIISDIAHHLSRVCRFGGAVNGFYSVAQHSIHVASVVGTFLPQSAKDDPKAYLYALLHDAHEAYTGDIVRPLKRSVPEWSVVEDRVQEVIYQAYDLDNVSSAVKDAVKRADDALLATEMEQLLEPCLFPWSSPEEPVKGLRLNGNETPGTSKAFFMQVFKKLRPE